MFNECDVGWRGNKPHHVTLYSNAAAAVQTQKSDISEHGGRNATADDGNGMQCKHARKWDEGEGIVEQGHRWYVLTTGCCEDDIWCAGQEGMRNGEDGLSDYHVQGVPYASEEG